MHTLPTLRGLEKVTEFLKLVLVSGNIDGVRPLSVILSAPVSNGKTTSVKQFITNSNILMTTDTTAYGILEKYGEKLKNREIRHIVIPDLLNALARRKTTVETFLLFINASSEDGIFPSNTFAYEVKDFIEPFGWVLCITDEAFKRKQKFLESIGFVSRFFIIKYKYDRETLNQILQNIITETRIQIPDIKLKSYKNKKKIKGNVEIFNKLTLYAKFLCSSNDGAILRMQRNLQTLAKASAYLRGDDKVTEADLKKIESLVDILKESQS